MDLPLDDHNLILLLELEGIIEQRIGFMFIHLVDQFGHQSGHLAEAPS